MAQGPPKKSILTKKASVSKRSHASNPKKGARTIAPKKKNLVDQKKLTKVRWESLQSL
ncbi:MAG: hypothetical protein LQ345_000970 [Seirophora villosa]|nr:MAG: hypothetical protein LQ345_000970 [Seirophora villosa]